jgi:hypothetical protein
MNAVVEVVKELGPVVATGSFTLGAVWLTQRAARRERADDRTATDIGKTVDAAQELVNAVSSLQIVLVQSVPLWNSWQPKLAVLGSVFLEFTAASKSGGLEQGVLQASRVTLAHQAQELAGLDRYRISFERVAAALAAVAVLPDKEIRAAGERIGEAIGASGQAYGSDGMWRPKRAAAQRALADNELSESVADLLRVVDQRRAAAPKPLGRWRRAVRRMRPTRLGARSPEQREVTAAKAPSP